MTDYNVGDLEGDEAQTESPVSDYFSESGEYGYQVFRLENESVHRLFCIRLHGMPSEPGEPPQFFAGLKGRFDEIINQNCDYRREKVLLYREFNGMRSSLTWSDYKEQMTWFLALWAADVLRQMKKLGRPTCYISNRDSDQVYAFHIEGCDQFVGLGDYLIAKNHSEGKIFIGMVKSVTSTEVVAKMPREFELAPKRKFEICFDIRWIPYVIQENCLNYAYAELGRSVIFPDRVARRQPLVAVNNSEGWLWHNQQLNHFQKEAVLNVLAGEHRPVPYLVSGPPGTGKTSTLIEYVHQVMKHLPDAKILICTPSNTAANVILGMMIKSQWYKASEVVIRMVSYAHIVSGTLPRKLKRFCGTLPMLEDVPTAMTVINSLAELTPYRVVITTINYCGNFMRMGLFKHFTHLVVDEAGQALETEMMVPLALMQKATAHLAMFGDEKQLGPVVLYQPLQKMAISMFERLSLRDIYYETPKLYSRLLNNYRSVPHLLKFYNQLFYQERLIAMITESRSPEFKLLDSLEDIFPPSASRMRHRGLYFFRVLSDCQRDANSYSWFNTGEAVRLVDFYKTLLDKKVKCVDIGVITPYRAQNRELLDEIRRRKLPVPKVGTVEVFQGDERMIMLMSPVRSYINGNRSMQRISLGFVNDPKRINVAISRGRALHVIFGNDKVLSACSHWSKLIALTDTDSTLIL